VRSLTAVLIPYSGWRDFPLSGVDQGRGVRAGPNLWIDFQCAPAYFKILNEKNGKKGRSHTFREPSCASRARCFVAGGRRAYEYVGCVTRENPGGQSIILTENA
jgi:hypothetical protein